MKSLEMGKKDVKRRSSRPQTKKKQQSSAVIYEPERDRKKMIWNEIINQSAQQNKNKYIQIDLRLI